MDDILYYILFTVGSIVMFGLNNWAEKKRKQGNGTPPPVNKRNIGNLPPDDDDDDDDDDNDNTPGSKDPTEVTWGELFELIKEVSTPTKQQPQRQPRQATPVHRQVVQQTTPQPKQSYVIESPEMEGQSVTNAKQSTTTDHVYDMPNADLSSDIRNTDWRRAVIAHEILKRKF